MFRFLAFSWSPADPEQAAFARELDHALGAGEQWSAAFNMPGHRVYVTGARRAINDVHPMPSRQGVILGRLFRRNAPPERGKEDHQLSDQEARRIVQSDGQVLIDDYWGRYVAFLPSWTGEPRVLRDPTGALPCFRLVVRGVAVVLSWLQDLRDLVGEQPASVNWDAVAALMAFGRLEGRHTALEGVTQVLPGELTSVGSQSAPLTLWNPVDFSQRATPTEAAEASRQLRQEVIGAARSWATCYGNPLLRLSGGLDSAILLGCIGSDATSPTVMCLNYFTPSYDGDERVYARLAAEQANASLTERTLDPEFKLEMVLDVALTPAPVNYIGSMATNRTDAEVAAAQEATAVFTGAGGDQLFFEFRRTWPAADYLKQRGVRPGFLDATLDAAHLGRVSFWRALRLAFKDQSFRGSAATGAGRSSTLMASNAREAAVRTAARFAHPALLAASNLPIGKFHHLSMLLSPFDYYDHYLRAAAPEMVHPLMSQPVLEQCLATPTYLLTHGGRGRALARRAFADLVPPAIATRRSKGGMDMHVAAVLETNLPFARALLLDGHLARQGLLDRQRIEAALSGRPSATAAYVSEVHACIAIEAWLQGVMTPPAPRIGV